MRRLVYCIILPALLGCGSKEVLSSSFSEERVPPKAVIENCPGVGRLSFEERSFALRQLTLLLLRKEILEIESVALFSGPCAAHIDRTVGGYVVLKGGTSLDLNSDQVSTNTSRIGRAISFRPAAFEKVQAREKVKLGPAVFLNNSDRRDGPVKYVAIVKDRTGWGVASFSADHVSYTDFRMLLRSRLPLLGIGFMPSPDSADGALELLQYVSKGLRRRVRLNFVHG